MNGKNIETRLIVVLAAITAISVGVSIWALFFRSGESPAPDYAQVEVEENAEAIADDEGGSLDAPEGGGAVSLTYKREVGVSLSEKRASLLFANPARSTQDAVVQLMVGETVVAKSGRIVPGYQVTSLALEDGAETLLSPGGCDGKLVVLYYDPVTGERAMLDTEIPASVTVTP